MAAIDSVPSEALSHPPASCPADIERPEPWKKATAGTIPVRHLKTSPADEQARREAPAQPGYCVDELCSCRKHYCVPSRQPLPLEGTTVYCSEYTSKLNPDELVAASRSVYGPDGVPRGVDPKRWADYIKVHGIPPQGQIPASLFYNPTPETRTFVTESRGQYVKKAIDPGVYTPNQYDSRGIPKGVNEKLWKEYIQKHGAPPEGQIPAYLYYKPPAETRDFRTSYRDNYVAKDIDVCPVTYLPPYPMPKWPREHIFWDPQAKKWY